MPLTPRMPVEIQMLWIKDKRQEESMSIGRKRRRQTAKRKAQNLKPKVGTLIAGTMKGKTRELIDLRIRRNLILYVNDYPVVCRLRWAKMPV